MKNVKKSGNKLFLRAILKDLQMNKNNVFSFEEDNSFSIIDKENSAYKILIDSENSFIKIQDIMFGLFEISCNDKKIVIKNHNGNIETQAYILDRYNYSFSSNSLNYVEYFTCYQGILYHGVYKKEYINRTSKFDSGIDDFDNIIYDMFGNLMEQFPNLINYIIQNISLSNKEKNDKVLTKKKQ